MVKIKNKQEKIDIILMHGTGTKELANLCVHRIVDNTKYPYRILLVNNQQHDLHFDNSNIEVIEVEENIGSSKGIIKALEHYNSKYFSFVSNDVFVSENWLTNIMKHFKSDVGAVGPISDIVIGRQQVKYTLYPDHKEEEAQFLSGFCLVTRRKAYDDAGGQDPNFFSGDDIDISLRMKEKGWKLLIARDVFCKHLGGLTTKNPQMNKEGIEKLVAKHGEEKIHGTRDEGGISIKQGIMTPRPTIVMCIPIANDPFFDMFASTLTWKLPPDVRYILTHRTLVQKARRTGIDIAIRENSDYLMFIDSDMRFNFDTIYRLLAHNKDMIGAMTHRRKPPYQPCIFKYDGKRDHYDFIKDLTYKEGLIKVDAMGMAFTLIKTKVLKALPEPFTACEFTIHPKTRGIVGEDINLCKHIKKAGFKIWCDTTLEVQHIGDNLMVDSNVSRQFFEYQKRLKEQVKKKQSKLIVPNPKIITWIKSKKK